MNTLEVIAAVRGDLEWAYAAEYGCPHCGRVSVDGRPHLGCVRQYEQNRLTTAELADVLAVGPDDPAS